MANNMEINNAMEILQRKMNERVSKEYSVLIGEVNDSLHRILNMTIQNAEALEAFIKQVICEARISLADKIEWKTSTYDTNMKKVTPSTSDYESIYAPTASAIGVTSYN